LYSLGIIGGALVAPVFPAFLPNNLLVLAELGVLCRSSCEVIALIIFLSASNVVCCAGLNLRVHLQFLNKSVFFN